MNVFRHDDVGVNAEAEVAAHSLEGIFEGLSARVGREQRTAVDNNRMLRSGFVRCHDIA